MLWQIDVPEDYRPEVIVGLFLAIALLLAMQIAPAIPRWRSMFAAFMRELDDD
jgi:hypothetical protein